MACAVPPVKSAIQHLAAGVVVAATALELLPQERQGRALPLMLGFGIGLGVMLMIRWLARTWEQGQFGESRQSVGLLAVTGLDLLIDGLVLGIGFVAGQQTGMLLAVALTVEVLFLGLSVASSLAESGRGRAWIIGMPAGLALLLIVGAGIGVAVFSQLPAFAFTAMLGFGTVALLYLVTEELLVEAHEVEETPWAVAAFFAGFLFFFSCRDARGPIVVRPSLFRVASTPHHKRDSRVDTAICWAVLPRRAV